MSNKKTIKVKKKKEEEQVDGFTQTIRDSLKTMGKTANPYQEQLLVQLLKSFLIGGIATILDLIIYFILYHFVKIDPIISNTISMILTFIFGLVVGIIYVYDKKNRERPIKEYSMLSFIGFVITEGMILGLVFKLKWNAMLVKVLAIIIVLVVKTLIRRFIISKK